MSTQSKKYLFNLQLYDPELLQESPLRLCSYLPDRASQLTFISLAPDIAIGSDLYQHLTHQGFRRSSSAFYRPNCRHCMQCIACRVIVEDFKPSRRFRKVLNRNAQVDISLHAQIKSIPEHYALYEKYIYLRHADGDMYPPNLHTFEQFLLTSPATTFFIEAREPNGQLIATAVTDKLNDGLSSIYTFFDPDVAFNSRSLGVYCILQQIQTAKALGLKYVYLGYWIPTIKKMSYKTNYTPIELLLNGEWIRFDDPPDADVILNTLKTFPQYIF